MNDDSIFLDFTLPNATTWFYFSALLAVALFFKFTRLYSVRNLDVLSMFLLVPGFLLMHPLENKTWYGYLWLFCVTAYFFARCVFDLALVSRPALGVNLNASGLAWLGGALLVSLGAVALREPENPQGSARHHPPLGDKAEQQAEHIAENLGLGDPRVWVGRSLAIACHLAVVGGLVFIGYRHFHDTHSGMAAATLYLLLPYTYLLMPFSGFRLGEWNHIWPAAILVWAVACYRMPTLSGFFLGLAAGTMYFPVILLPLWTSFYWRRGAGRFAAFSLITTALCLTFIGGTFWFLGDLPPGLRVELGGWQPWIELSHDTQGFWTGVPWAWAYRIPVFVAFTAFVITTMFWPSPKNLAHLIALTAATLLGLQLWYADRGGIYVFWYLPLLLLFAFRPNLSLRRPAIVISDKDWLTRLLRTVGRLFRRSVKPTPAQIP